MTGFWTDARVREALRLEPAPAALDSGYTAVGTDTRAMEPGTLFVALVGERFDAHDFLTQAAGRGARGAVVSRLPEDAPPGLVYYQLEDTLVALGALARYYRRHLGARVVAVAGTNGKTTTKNMTSAVLSTRYRVHATSGNFNNLIGAPLTILAAPAGTEAMIVEIGTNTPGEIAKLRDIVEPDAAIVTRLAEEHLEGLGDLAGVVREETAILEGLGGVAVVCDEPPELAERARALTPHVRVAGLSERADAELRAEAVRLDDEGRVRFQWQGREIRLALRGRFNAANALLALGLGTEWGVDAESAVRALATLEPAKMRMEVHRYGELRIVADCYNSNPASLAGAVELLGEMPRGGGRVAVIGTMLELGPASAEIHRASAEEVARAGLDLIVASGEFAGVFEPMAAELGERLIRVADPVDAWPELRRRLTGTEVVLLKASRGVKMERLLMKLEESFGGSGDAN